MSAPYFCQCLRRELAIRVERNQRYSLRAFARALEVPVSTLSRALTGKRSISVASAQRIASGLGLEPRERSQFFDSLARTPAGSTAKTTLSPTVTDLDEETFRVVADWQHYAILELTFLKAFRPQPAWIAARLGISTVEADLALERLLRVGLLKWNGKKLVKSSRTIWANAEGKETNAALRRFQQQCLTKALDALDSQPLAKRTASAMTIPIDPTKLPLARRMIQEFAVELCRTLATGDMTDVYQLSIHFHSLLKGPEA